MNSAIPIPSRYFKTIYDIYEGRDEQLDHELVNFLNMEGYVLSQGRFGWALTNKGREFIKTYRYDRCFMDVIRSDWPIDLVAVLRRCEFNSRPNLPEAKLKDLINTGYLIQPSTGEYHLTEKGKTVLARYHE